MLIKCKAGIVLGIMQILPLQNVWAQSIETHVSWPSVLVEGLPVPIEYSATGGAVIEPVRPWNDLNAVNILLDLQGQVYAVAENSMSGSSRECRWFPEHEYDNTVYPGSAVVMYTSGDGESAARAGDLLNTCMRHENNVDTFKMVHGVYVVSCDSSGMDNVIYPNTMEIVPASGEDLKLAKSIAVYLNSPINDVEMPTKIIVVWWDKITENIDLSHISSLAWDQIGYYALVSKLVHDPAPISTLSIQQLDTDRVWSPLLPEVDLLRAEIANAQDNDVVAAAASQSYLAARPGMEADVEYAAAAAGVIAKLREAVARR